MTIQIDDSGWGDLLGGAVIGCYRTETSEFVYRVIDTHFFQDPTFDQKHYLTEASRLVQEMIRDLKVDVTEPIQVCTGYVLSHAVCDLRRRGFNVSTGKITGPLQELGEHAFLNELRKLSYEPIPNREANGKMRAKSFHHMLNWMREKPERRQFAKTGWGFFTGKPKRRWGRRGEWEDE